MRVSYQGTYLQRVRNTYINAAGGPSFLRHYSGERSAHWGRMRPPACWHVKKEIGHKTDPRINIAMPCISEPHSTELEQSYMSPTHIEFGLLHVSNTH